MGPAAALGWGIILILLVVGVVRVSRTITFKSPTDNKDKSDK